MISYAQVIIYSQSQVWIRNFIENQQTIISVIEAIAIYHNIGESQYKSFSASPHTQLSFNLSQFLTLTRYLWVQSFASQLFTSTVMSTIILYDNLHLSGYIYLDLSRTHSACQKKKCKKERWRSPRLLYKGRT